MHLIEKKKNNPRDKKITRWLEKDVNFDEVRGGGKDDQSTLNEILKVIKIRKMPQVKIKGNLL